MTIIDAAPRVCGDLFARSSHFSRAFLVYNLPPTALVVREWPTISQKQTRDRFWAKFSAHRIPALTPENGELERKARP